MRWLVCVGGLLCLGIVFVCLDVLVFGVGVWVCVFRVGLGFVVCVFRVGLVMVGVLFWFWVLVWFVDLVGCFGWLPWDFALGGVGIICILGLVVVVFVVGVFFVFDVLVWVWC